MYGCDIGIFFIIGINEDIVLRNNDENVELLGQNLVNVFLKAC